MNAFRIILLMLCVNASGDPVQVPDHVNPEKGKALIKQVGCGSCHQIPAIDTAQGQVGPPLVAMNHRGYLAGILPNHFKNMVLWIQHPQRVAPESAMPDLGLSTAEAEDIAAFLYSQE